MRSEMGSQKLEVRSTALDEQSSADRSRWVRLAGGGEKERAGLWAGSHGESVWRRNRTGRCGGCLLRLPVDEILQFLAGLEIRNLLRRNVHLVTGFWVTALAGLSLAKAEAAKTAEFDLLAAMQRVDDALEH